MSLETSQAQPLSLQQAIEQLKNFGIEVSEFGKISFDGVAENEDWVMDKRRNPEEINLITKLEDIPRVSLLTVPQQQELMLNRKDPDLSLIHI